MSDRSSRQVWHGSLVKASAGALLLGVLTALLSVRLASVTADLDLAPLSVSAPTPGTIAPLVEVPVLGIGCLVAGWWSLSLALVTLALLAQAVGLQGALLRTCIRTMAPAAVRRLAVAGIGAGLVLSAGPAMAAEPVPDLGWVSTGTPEPGPAPSPDASHTPDLVDDSLTASTSPPEPTPPVRPDTSGSESSASDSTGTDRAPTVTVATGDSLWSITATSLGPGATDAEISAAWPALYSANSVTIGTDPDVIVAGQVLLAPPAPHVL